MQLSRYRIETTVTAKALFNLCINVDADNEEAALDLVENMDSKELIEKGLFYLTKKLQIDEVEAVHVLNEYTRTYELNL